MAAGVSAWVYSRFGRRIGYGNSQAVWVIVAVGFVLTFLIFFTLLRYVINLHG